MSVRTLCYCKSFGRRFCLKKHFESVCIKQKSSRQELSIKTKDVASIAMQKETAAQTLLRTALRYYKIRHLDFETKKRLMALTQEEFEDEFSRINSRTA